MKNWTYPSKLDSNKRVATTDDNNDGRIQLALDIPVGLRPMRPTYGSILYLLEQSPINPDSAVINASVHFRNMMNTFASDYMIVTGATVTQNKDTERTVEVNINYDSKI